ncbi:hypothetical protein KVT40_007519 [Elsinoe batatas]|uniref:Uncharacterized protein n=1 Tax=Elsinoe batatas TaxID=2601811 RepID=A0A8K0PDC4_9PEZI|nr:hypothetical protein KVT40_007519 [Elsinoe batatas]
MKPVSLLAAAALSAQVMAYRIHIVYSSQLVEVGDINLFAATWEKIYAAPGNQNAVALTEPGLIGSATNCGKLGDTTVGVSIEGQWGKDPGLGLETSRDALVKSLWEFIQVFGDDEAYDVFAPCGAQSKGGAPRWFFQADCRGQYCGGCCAASSCGCQFKKRATKMPAKIKLTMTNNAGTLLPDGITVDFTSTKASSNGGCGVALKVVGALAGFLPGPGSLFSSGVSAACEAV